jgi:hypothetical protein
MLKGDTLTMGYPPDWRPIDYTTGSIDTVLKPIPLNAGMRLLLHQTALDKTVKLILLHAPEQVGYAPNVTIRKMAISQSLTLDKISTENVEGLKRIAIKPPIAYSVIINGGPAERIEWSSRYHGKLPINSLDQVTFILLRGHIEYILAFSAAPGNNVERFFNQMASTFTIS